MVSRRSLLLVLAAVLSFASRPAVAQEAETLAAGSMAPPLVIEQWPRGVPVTRFERGRVYVVEFWATWCTPCHLVVPKLTELQRNNPALTVISVAASEQATTVNRDDRLEKVQDYVSKRSDEIGFTIAYDGSGEMWRRWMVPAQRGGIPAAFIVGPDGRLTWIGNPLVPDFEKDLAATLARPDVNMTPAPTRWTPTTPSPRPLPVVRPSPAAAQPPIAAATVPARASNTTVPQAKAGAQTTRSNAAPREFKIEFVPESVGELRPNGLASVRDAAERATPSAVTKAAAPSTPKASSKAISKGVVKPSAKPANKPAAKPTPKPTPKPTSQPTSKPTKPVAKPGAAPR